MPITVKQIRKNAIKNNLGFAQKYEKKLDIKTSQKVKLKSYLFPKKLD